MVWMPSALKIFSIIRFLYLVVLVGRLFVHHSILDKMNDVCSLPLEQGNVQIHHIGLKKRKIIYIHCLLAFDLYSGDSFFPQ